MKSIPITKIRQLFIVFLLIFPLSKLLNAQTISGLDTICAGQSTDYQLNIAGGKTFQWYGTRAYPSATNVRLNYVTFGNPGFSTVYVDVLDSNGVSLGTFSKLVFVDPKPHPYINSDNRLGCNMQDDEFMMLDTLFCEKVCESSTVTYRTRYYPGHIYYWKVTGATSFVDSANTVTVVWGNAPATGLVEVIQYNENDCSRSFTKCVEIIEAPSISADLRYTDNANRFEGEAGQDFWFLDLVYITGATTYLWDFGDGTTSTLQRPMHRYIKTGDYRVKAYVWNDCGCVDSLIQDVRISVGQDTDIQCISTVCEGDVETYFDLKSPTKNYMWNVIPFSGPFKNNCVAGQYSPLGSISWNYLDGARGYGSLFYEEMGSGIYRREFVPIITSNAALIVGDIIVCAKSQYEYEIPPYPGSIFNWTVTGGAFAANGMTTYSGPDLRKVRVNWGNGTTGSLNVVFDNQTLGCNDTLETAVTIIHPFEITGPTKGCVNNNITFSAGSSGNYNWSVYFTNPVYLFHSFSGGSTFNYAFQYDGKYQVKAEPTSGNFCNSEFSHEIEVNGAIVAPSVFVGETTICPGGYYNYSSSPVTSNYYLKWDVTGGIASSTNGGMIGVQWNNSGPYQIKVWQESKARPHCTTDTLVKNITPQYFQPPDISGDTTACADLVFAYKTTAIADNYEWELTPSRLGSITGDQYSDSITILWNSGNWLKDTAILKLTTVNCLDTNNHQIAVVVINNPTPVIVSDSVFCEAEAALFVDGTGINAVTSRTWDLGWGGFANPTDSFTGYFPDPGAYDVKLSVTYGGECPTTKSIIKLVNVNEKPVVKMSGNGLICPSSDTAFRTYLIVSGQQTINQYYYQWYKNNNQIAPTNPPLKHVPYLNGRGHYYVKATNKATGCKAKSNTFIVDTCIIGPPCIPDSSHDWKYSYDSITGTLDSSWVNWLYDSYSIDSLTVNCGVVTASIASTGPLTAYEGFLFQDESYTTDSTGLTATYTKAGSYLATVFFNVPDTGRINPGRCPIEHFKRFVVPLVADFSIDYTCYSLNQNYTRILLEDESSWYVDSITSWNWYVDGVQVPTIGPWATVELPAGQHTFKLEVASMAESCSMTKTFNVPQKGKADFSIASGPFCERFPVAFTDLSTGPVESWAWDFDDGAYSAGQSPSRTYKIDDRVNNSFEPKFPKLIIQDSIGCRDTISYGVTVNRDDLYGGIIKFDPNSTFYCDGDSVKLFPDFGLLNPPVSSYNWTTGATTPIIYGKATGFYGLYAEDNDGCRKHFIAKNIGFAGKPVAIPRGETSYCPGEQVELEMYNGPFDYQWYRAGILASDSGYLSYKAGNPGSEIITAVVSDGTCADTAEIVITVNNRPQVSEITASPNNCELSYPVLSATASGNDISYHWSTGDNTNSTKVYTAGRYRLVVSNGVGCDTTVETNVFERPDFTSLMKGCYYFCPSDTPVVFQGLDPWRFTSKWLPQGSAGSTVNGTELKLNTFNSYEYRLAAYNMSSPACADTSEPINISISNCEECHPSELQIIEVKCGPRDQSWRLTYEIIFSLQGNSPGAITSVSMPTSSTLNHQLNKYSVGTGLDTFKLTLTKNTFNFGQFPYNLHLNVKRIGEKECSYITPIPYPNCLEPCGVDQFNMLSSTCIGYNPDGDPIYEFSASVNNTISSPIYMFASTPGENRIELSTEVLAPGINTFSGITIMGHANDYMHFGFYNVLGNPDSNCCEVRKYFPGGSNNCNKSDCDIDLDYYEEPECVGIDSEGNHMYYFTFELMNHGSTSDMRLMALDGSIAGLNTTTLYNGLNVITGYYTDLVGGGEICFELLVKDQSSQEWCRTDFCIDPLNNCNDVDFDNWSTKAYCSGNNGDGELVYTFGFSLLPNTGGISGDLISFNPSVKIEVLPNGYVNGSIIFDQNSAYGDCIELLFHDKINQYSKLYELCFEDHTSCCTQLIPGEIEYKRKQEKEIEGDDQLSMNIYPNPTLSISTIDYKLGTASAGKLIVTNMYNTEVRNFDVQGMGSIQLDTEDLPGGMYIVQLVHGDQKLVEKLIVIKY